VGFLTKVAPKAQSLCFSTPSDEEVLTTLELRVGGASSPIRALVDCGASNNFEASNSLKIASSSSRSCLPSAQQVMTSTSAIRIKLRTFSGSHLRVWLTEVRTYLEIQGVWDSALLQSPTAEQVTQDQANGSNALAVAVQNQKVAFSIILSALDDVHAEMVIELDHPQAVLRRIRDLYSLQCSANVGDAKRRYLALYLKDGDSLREHVKTTRQLLSELRDYEVVVTDDERKTISIQSLGPAWNGYVASLEACKSFDEMLLVAQSEALRREKQLERGAEVKNGAAGGAFTTTTQSGKKAFKMKKGKKKGKCFNCGIKGHFAAECRKPKKDDQATATELANVGFAFAAGDCSLGDESMWIVDSGATSHMTGCVRNLVDVVPLVDPLRVRVASGAELRATAVGKAPLEHNGSIVCTLQVYRMWKDSPRILCRSRRHRRTVCRLHSVVTAG
jgi:hypothetical protein